MVTSEVQTTTQDRTETATLMAEQRWECSIAQDERDRQRVIDVFAEVSHSQFADLEPSAAKKAALGDVDALWASDALEGSAMHGGAIDRDNPQGPIGIPAARPPGDGQTWRASTRGTPD